MVLSNYPKPPLPYVRDSPFLIWKGMASINERIGGGSQSVDWLCQAIAYLYKMLYIMMLR